jgi:hypothetical protein
MLVMDVDGVLTDGSIVFADDGSELVADPDVTAAVLALRDIRERITGLKSTEDTLETAIKTRMAEAAVLVGDGFHVVWRRTKDRQEVDWKELGAALIADRPEAERAALVGQFVTVRPGFRPFRVTFEKGDSE